MVQELKKIMHIQGVSGREKPVMTELAGLIRPYADEIRTDALGNLIACQKGASKSGKTVMLCAHADEIGFIVTFIEKNGWVRIAPIGGLRPWNTLYREVVFSGGTRGVIVPDAGQDVDNLSFEKCYVDIGASTGKEAERMVRIGETLAVAPNLVRLRGTRYAGRPVDDRLGCAILLEIARNLSGKACPHTVYYVFSVQEEVGCRGSGPASFDIRPDYSLAFDVTGTGDVPGATPMACSVGKGAAVKIKDGSVICHTEVVRRLRTLASERKIKYQDEILLHGGTDTSMMQGTGMGSKAGALSVPTRYIHSAVELFDLKDAQACADLGAAFCMAPEQED